MENWTIDKHFGGMCYVLENKAIFSKYMEWLCLWQTNNTACDARQIQTVITFALDCDDDERVKQLKNITLNSSISTAKPEF